MRKKSEWPNFDLQLSFDGSEMTKKATHWVFTEHAVLAWLWGDKLPPNVRHMLYQKEKGKKTMKIHLQGMLSLNERQRLSWLKNNISKTAHWEPRRGTFEQALKYNCKEDTRIGDTVELGERVTIGQRSDRTKAFLNTARQHKRRMEVTSHIDKLWKIPRMAELHLYLAWIPIQKL